MKNVSKLGVSLNRIEMRAILGGTQIPNCGANYCDESKGFFCNALQNACVFLGDMD